MLDERLYLSVNYCKAMGLLWLTVLTGARLFAHEFDRCKEKGESYLFANY